MRLRPRGVRLVMGLELRQRVRSKRWYVALGTWFVLLTGMSVLIGGAALWVGGAGVVDDIQVAGAVVFSASVLLLIFAMLLVIPAMSAGAINGDRTAGTLATLQATLLSPLEIVVGKVLAGWCTGLTFLVAALPSVVPGAIAAGVGPIYLLSVLAMIAVLTLCITAIGVGLSSLTARPLGSVVLAYLAVLGTTTILPIIASTAAPFLVVDQEVTVHTYAETTAPGTNDAVTDQCVDRREVRTVIRSDLLMPLLWPNPFVIVADVAPPIQEDESGNMQVDALRGISLLVRLMAHPTDPANFQECWDEGSGGTAAAPPETFPVWPMGLALHLLLAGGAIALATARINAPHRRIGAGTRIA